MRALVLCMLMLPAVATAQTAERRPRHDWSAPYRWVHFDNQDSSDARGFETARKTWLRTLERDGTVLDDGRPLIWACSEGVVHTWVTLYPFTKFADLDARREAFERLAGMHRLDWKQMRTRIRDLVKSKDAATLNDLIDVYPLEGGIIELLGYLQIARDDGHLVNPSAIQTLIVPPNREGRKHLLVNVPLVTFTSGREQPNAR